MNSSLRKLELAAEASTSYDLLRHLDDMAPRDNQQLTKLLARRLPKSFRVRRVPPRQQLTTWLSCEGRTNNDILYLIDDTFEYLETPWWLRWLA